MLGSSRPGRRCRGRSRWRHRRGWSVSTRCAAWPGRGQHGRSQALVTRAGEGVRDPDGGWPHVAGMGIPARRRPPHRRAGVPALEHVDLRARRVRVVSFVSTLGHNLQPSTGRSRDAVRTIDLDEGLVGVLRQQRKLQAEKRLAASSWVDSGMVFTKLDGEPYHPQYLSKLLGRYTEELGLPRLTAHGLRHTSATLMLASGVPPRSPLSGSATPMPRCSPTCTAMSPRPCSARRRRRSERRCLGPSRLRDAEGKAEGDTSMVDLRCHLEIGL